MRQGHKVKVSVTIDSDVLAQVDAYAQDEGGLSRSEVIQEWLRVGARRRKAQELENSVIAYYESLSAEERKEDEAWARSATDHFSKLDID